MSAEVVAIAHPNVALSKYWGKREIEGNVPAVPSLSVTLEGLVTRTRVRWQRDLAFHRVVLDGRELAAASAQTQQLDNSLGKMKKERDVTKLRWRKARRGDIDKSLREVFSARMMTLKK